MNSYTEIHAGDIKKCFGRRMFVKVWYVADNSDKAW
jgi:hypothetical protein